MNRGACGMYRAALLRKREETADYLPRAVAAPAGAVPARVIVEHVEPVVDRDFLIAIDGSPGEDNDAVSHRIRVTGVIEIAAGWQEHGARLEVELTEVALVILGESADLLLAMMRPRPREPAPGASEPWFEAGALYVSDHPDSLSPQQQYGPLDALERQTCASAMDCKFDSDCNRRAQGAGIRLDDNS